MVNDFINWFINLSTTDFIALLAFIVALYGAVLSTIIFHKEKLKLKLEYLDKNYFSLSRKELTKDNHGFQYWTYSENSYSLAILVRISNNSKSNTTINSFVLNNKYVLNSSSKPQNYFSVKFKKENSEITEKSFEILNVLQPLITLSPFEAVEGYLIFDNISEIPTKFKMQINAIQRIKNYTLNFKLNDHTKIE